MVIDTPYIGKIWQVGVYISTAVAVDREKHIRLTFPTERVDSNCRISSLGLLLAVLLYEMGAFSRRFAKVRKLLEPIQFRQADGRR